MDREPARGDVASGAAEVPRPWRRRRPIPAFDPIASVPGALGALGQRLAAASLPARAVHDAGIRDACMSAAACQQ